MSKSAFDNGDTAAGGAATRAIAVRSAAQELDYRLRGLHSGDLPATSPRTDHKQRRRRRALTKVGIFVGVVVLAVALLRAFVIQPFTLHANAMAPTLKSGDRILVAKSGLLAGSIHRGDIVVFHPPGSLPCTVVGSRAGDLALRVVALPGQVIWSVGQSVFVDGRPLQEKGWYDHRFGQVGSTPIRSTTLAPGEYFVMADRRSDACDSRAFGPVSKSSVVGKGVAVVGRNGHVSFATL
jgi:signal peptidase I